MPSPLISSYFIKSAQEHKPFAPTTPIELNSTRYFVYCGMGGVLACGYVKHSAAFVFLEEELTPYY